MPASLKPRTVKEYNTSKKRCNETDALWLATTVLTTRPWPLWQNKKHQHLQNFKVSPSKLIFLGEENFSNVSEAEKLIGKSNNLNSNLQLQRMLSDDTFSAAEMEPNFRAKSFLCLTILRNEWSHDWQFSWSPSRKVDSSHAIYGQTEFKYD